VRRPRRDRGSGPRSGGLRYGVNCSILFTELPLSERPVAARSAGFEAVEFWWPFDTAVPSDAEADAFVAAIENAGVALASLNLFAGDMAAGERGLLSWPGRETEFRDSVEAALGIAERLGCRVFNALWGNRLDGVDPQAQDELGAENLRFAAQAAHRIDGTIAVEPISTSDAYPLRTAADALAVIDRAPGPGVGLLADLYHLAVNGDDVDRVIAEHAGRIAHVQLADAPGRHQPGSGELPLRRYLAALRDRGYDGWVCLEYEPIGPSGESFERLGDLADP